MKRYVVLGGALLMQLCLGALYSWSTHVPALREAYGFTASQAAAVFGASIAVFTIAMIPAGRLLSRNGPRAMAGAGTLLFGAGYVVASYSGGSFPWIFGGIGIMVGTAIGMCYTCPLTACVAWFPERKGLITGFAVAGFGAGAVVLSNVVEYLLAHGMDVLTVFRWTGIVNGGVAFAGAMALSMPPKCPRAATANCDLGVIARTRHFWSLVAGMFAGTFAGLLVIGNLKSIGISNGVDIAQAGLAVSTFAIGNSLGRIAWGAAYDRYGRPCLSLSLLLLSLCVGSLWLVRDPVFFMLCSGAVGFLFGSCFVLYVADLTAEQGSRSVAHVYPFVFLAYGFSGLVGPVVGGWVFDIFSSYAYACMGAGLVALAGSVAVVALNRGSLANGQIAVTEKEAAGITG